MQTWQRDFLERVLPYALKVQSRTGVPASLALAQAILESNWGRSLLAERGRNLFGMKRARRHRRWINFPTVEVQDGKRVTIQAQFARYASEAESFEDWARLLSSSSRYAGCLRLAHDPVAMASCIRQVGYSTDPLYAAKVERLIAANCLGQYDAGPCAQGASAWGGEAT